MNWKQSRLFAIIAVLAAMMLVAGCDLFATDPGNDEEEDEDEPVLQVAEHDDYGHILVDGEGFTVYVWDRDNWDEGVSACIDIDDCLDAWPLVTSPTAQVIVAEDVPGTYGVVELGDEFYVTLLTSVMPLYTFDGDEAPGDVNGQMHPGFGDDEYYWWILVVDLDDGTVMPLIEEEENNNNDNNPNNPGATEGAGY